MKICYNRIRNFDGIGRQKIWNRHKKTISFAIFPGGYVTYLNETKIFIGVEEEIIRKYGVYSKECAEERARTVQEKMHTDIAI